MADSSLSFTDTSSSGGVQAIAVAACNVQRDGTEDVEIYDDGADHEVTNFGYDFVSRQLNSNHLTNSTSHYIATPVGTPQGTPGTRFLISAETVPEMPVCGSEQDLRSRSGSRDSQGMVRTMTSLSPS